MKKQSHPTVSVVIPTLNEAKNISRLLQSLQTQTHKPAEVLVVDGGSTDTTTEIVKSFANVSLIQTTPPVGDQRNIGGEKARAEIIFFMDADIYPASNFIEKCLEKLSKNKADVACPWTYPHQSTVLIQSIFLFFNALFWLLQWWRASGGGMCLIVRKNVFHQTQGFNQKLTFEDIEFIRRASASYRFRMLTVPLAVSDRRFRQDGTLITFVKYLTLGILFSLGFFKWANFCHYQFGHYKNS